MSENKLSKKINAFDHKKIVDNSIEITDKFNEEQQVLIDKVNTFFSGIDENFDTDKIKNLKVHLEDVFLFRPGPLGGLLAGNVGDDIVLSRKLLTKPDYVKIFAVTHEIVHFLTNSKKTESDKKHIFVVVII